MNFALFNIKKWNSQVLVELPLVCTFFMSKWGPKCKILSAIDMEICFTLTFVFALLESNIDGTGLCWNPLFKSLFWSQFRSFYRHSMIASARSFQVSHILNRGRRSKSKSVVVRVFFHKQLNWSHMFAPPTSMLSACQCTMILIDCDTLRVRKRDSRCFWTWSYLNVHGFWVFLIHVYYFINFWFSFCLLTVLFCFFYLLTCSANPQKWYIVSVRS